MDTYLLYKVTKERNLPLEETLNFISYIHIAYADKLMTADKQELDMSGEK